MLNDTVLVTVDGDQSVGTIWSLTESGFVPRRSVELPGGSMQMNDTDHDVMWQKLMERYDDSPLIRDPHYPDLWSAWTGLESGGETSVWIRRGGRQAFLDGVQEWVEWSMVDDSFTELRLPKDVRARHFFQNLIVAVRRDPLDVQSLQLYRVRW